MNSRSTQPGFESVRDFHRGVSTFTARPRHRKWVFAGMLAAAAGVLVWRCVNGSLRRS